MAASDLAAVAAFNGSLRYCSHCRPLLWWGFFPKQMKIAAADRVSPLWTRHQGTQEEIDFSQHPNAATPMFRRFLCT